MTGWRRRSAACVAVSTSTNAGVATNLVGAMADVASDVAASVAANVAAIVAASVTASMAADVAPALAINAPRGRKNSGGGHGAARSVANF